MNILDRIILSIYTILLIMLSLVVILLALNFFPLDLVWTSITYINGKWQAALIGFVLLMVSIRLLLAGVRSQKGRDNIVHHTEMGDVNISVSAVENLVERVARHIKGVRGIKVRVSSCEKGVKVKIKAVINPESNVPNVCTDMQKRVHEYIKNTVGVELADIQILVDNISNEFKVKQRVE